MVNLCRECKLIRFTLLGGGLSEARAFPEPGTLPELGGAPEPGGAFRSIPGARRSLWSLSGAETFPGARRSLPGPSGAFPKTIKGRKLARLKMDFWNLFMSELIFGINSCGIDILGFNSRDYWVLKPVHVGLEPGQFRLVWLAVN